MKVDRGEWRVYLLECSDGTLYCGISNDVDRRVTQHNKGAGAKYTKTRLPVKLVWYTEETMSQSAALKQEYTIKQLSRQDKQRLVNVGAAREARKLEES